MTIMAPEGPNSEWVEAEIARQLELVSLEIDSEEEEVVQSRSQKVSYLHSIFN